MLPVDNAYLYTYEGLGVRSNATTGIRILYLRSYNQTCTYCESQFYWKLWTLLFPYFYYAKLHNDQLHTIPYHISILIWFIILWLYDDKSCFCYQFFLISYWACLDNSNCRRYTYVYIYVWYLNLPLIVWNKENN